MRHNSLASIMTAVGSSRWDVDQYAFIAIIVSIGSVSSINSYIFDSVYIVKLLS